ncbi:MAG TPA: hypothetical protein VF203_03990 [Burkholderiales bacterium]
MSIFKKDCPECATPNPADAISCRCGYCFDPDALARTNPDAYAHQQDRLYRDYLAARIAQAEAELAVARQLASEDPENTYKASSALLAEQALNALRAEMREVVNRLAAARAAHAGSPPAPPTPVRRPPERAARGPTPASAPPRAASPAAPRPAPAASPPMPPPAPSAAAHRTPPAPKSPAPAPAMSSRPGKKFRQLQAQRAEAIARAHAAAPRPPRAAAAVARAAPVNRGAPAHTSAPPMQECPNCTASVPADRTRCGCGYTLSRAAQEVPPLTLDAGALAILTEGLAALKNRTGG